MRIRLLVLAVAMLLLTGCAADNSQDRLANPDFSVVGVDEQPQMLKEIIAQRGELAFQLSYSVGEDLYIAVGYGIQQSGGYSITVNEFYETTDNIVIDTSLIGPGDVQNVTDTTSIPYIVIKTHNIEDKIIEFR